MNERALDELRLAIKTEMSEERYRHTLGVEKEIRALARYFLPEKETVAAAGALLHDLTKGWSEEEHFAFCMESGLALTEDERKIPALLHAKTAAALIPIRYPEFANEEVLSAVSKHTAACAEMTVTDALLYIADFTEEGREYEACRAARRLLHDGMARGALPQSRLLRQVLLAIYDASLCALKRLGRPVAKATQEAKEALLANDCYFS